MPAFTPAALLGQQAVGQLAIHGERVVYTLRTTHDGADRTELWQVPYAGGEPARLVTGSTPRLSPDGTALAYLHADGDAPAQVWLLSGTARRLTDFPRGAHDLAWGPDGTWLAVLAEDDESPAVHHSPAHPAGPDHTPTALVLRRADWRADGDGEHGLVLYPRHVHRVPVDGGPPQRLSAGPWSAARPRVDAHGRVHVLADPRPDADLAPARQVFRLDEAMTALTSFAGGVVRYHLIPGGVRALAHQHPDRPDGEPARWFDVRAGAEAEPLAAEPWLGLLGEESDLHDWHLELDDTPATTTRSAAGCTRPVDVETGAALIDGPVTTGAIAEHGPRRVAVLALGDAAPDVYALDAGGPRRLTAHGAWLAGYARPRFEQRDVPGPAGPITVHLLHPGDPGPRPTVLLLHGGPTGQWSVTPTVEALVLAGAGFLVAMPNIRGSIDRGASWVAALRGAWGDVDAADALAVCDALVADGIADPARLGVSGLSYGGFLTQWLVGVTDRFAAAVSENGVTNQVAAWAGCADGPAYNRSADLGDAVSPGGVERLWACSPLRNVGAVHTPLLMLQGGDDRTCPASDNEQFFVALRHLRREVEYVVYPEEGHLMQATGRLDRRLDRHARVLAWFERHLGTPR